MDSATPRSRKLAPGTYQVCVNVYDYAGNGQSASWYFTVSTDRAPEDIPVLTAPTGSGNGTTPEFDWTTVTYATSYGLWVDDLTSNTFYVIYQTGLAGTSFTPATALAGNHTFSAHVQAGNQFGYGYWSQPYIFATGNAPLGPPLDVPVMTAPQVRGTQPRRHSLGRLS